MISSSTEIPGSDSRSSWLPTRATLRDAYRGVVYVTHHGMAILGISLAALVLTLVARTDLRISAEQQLLGWLQERHDISPAAEADTNILVAGRVETPDVLPKQQAAVTQWLSRKYRVAQEPLAKLVGEAFAIGEKVKLDPTLILAVMAIESRFNPYAQSPVGAQGLMQVLTRVHTDKYARLGGQAMAFDPLSNLRVGVKVLQDCIKQAGSVEGGLRLYVGAVSTDGSDYINKVMSEHLRIQSVALGKPMPTSFPVYSAIPAALPVSEPPAPVEVAAPQSESSAEAPAQAPLLGTELRKDDLAS
ncbi:MAG: transglycosylase SLT domain-containing protein [Anaerolineales bacterium]|nr:transglycosylase SLT domain-containing protein [Anaerolineales bacterium]MCB2016742.1 transglycosylase SLT domain-containing protein [Hydrogenophaga sp.]